MIRKRVSSSLLPAAAFGARQERPHSTGAAGKTMATRILGPGRGPSLWRFPAVLLLSLILAACSAQDPQNTLMGTAGDVANKQRDLFWFIFALAVGVFVVVEGLLLFALFRFRRRPGQEDVLPPQTHGNTRLEVAWTIAPAIVLVFVAIPTVSLLFETAETPPIAVRVNVTGHQWWWEFQYADLGVVTANELHIPVGEAIDLQLESADVQHSFWVPKLAGKTDVLPGHRNRMWLRATDPGEYSAQCAELCGIQHATMRFRVIVQPRDEFDAWVRAQRTPPPPPGGPAAEGAQIFANPANGCIACHTVEGVPIAAGKIGPNLTHVGSRGTIVAGTLANDRENLSRWLRDTQQVKEGNLMRLPRALTDDEISKLVDYLLSLK